jgi:hypothetical protein
MNTDFFGVFMTVREITSHKVNGLNEALIIGTVDDPGAGGAHHHYHIEIHGAPAQFATHIRFQNGPIGENGPNGISNEAMLAIVADRLECFQKGQYACRENALALTKIQEAMHWLHHRTRERVARGVEGTSNK